MYGEDKIANSQSDQMKNTRPYHKLPYYFAY